MMIPRKSGFTSLRPSFTLVELLVIVAILVALLAAVRMVFDPFQRKGEAYDAEREIYSRQIYKAINDYLWERNYPPATFPATNEKKWICVNGVAGTACTDPPVNGVDLSFLVSPPTGLPFMETVPQDPIYANTQKTGLQLTKSGDYYQVLAPYTGVYYPPPDPIARWKLDDTSIGTVTEMIAGIDGTHMNMAAGSPTTDTPRVNIVNDRSLAFDGSNDYIKVENADPLVLNQTLTVAAWIWLASDFSGDNDIVMRSNGSGGNEFSFSVESDGDLSVHIDGTEYDGDEAPTDVWVHVAAVRSGASLAFYIDGLPAGIGSPGSKIINFGSCTTLLIGADADSSCIGGLGDYWEGKLDDIRLYDVALSAEQIRWLAEGLF